MRTTAFSATGAGLPGARGARLCERDAERLEDRVEDVLGVLPLDQANVERETRDPGGQRPIVRHSSALRRQG